MKEQDKPKAPKNQLKGSTRCNCLNDTIQYILQHFSIDPSTGIIKRDDRKNSCGSYDKDGYLIIKVKKKQFKAHRIAWLLYYGTFPKKEIDHINRNRTDNRKCNLREVTREENVRNTCIPPNKDTGCVGIYMDKSTPGLKKKFTTRLNNKTYRFYTIEEAKQFRLNNGKRIY